MERNGSPQTPRRWELRFRNSPTGMVDTKERTALRDLKDVCFPRALRNTILPYPHGMALLSKRTRKCSTRCLTEPTLLEIARYPVSWLWLADYTLDGCDRPLVDASARPNSPKRPAGNDVIIWSLSLRLFLSSSSSSLETTRPNNRSIFFKVAWCMASPKVAFRSLEQWARQHHDIK